MGIFNKNHNKSDFFELLENDVMAEYNTSEKAQPPKSITANIITAEELKGEAIENGEGSSLMSSQPTPLEALKLRMNRPYNVRTAQAASVDAEIPQQPNKENQDRETLLERCKAYTTDDEGKDFAASKKKLYKLESVAEILKSDSEKAIEKLSEKYDISVDELSLNDNSLYSSAADGKSLNSKPEASMEKSPYNTDPFHDADDLSSILGIVNENTDIPDISDIDNLQKREESIRSDFSDTATIKFTPIREAVEGESRMSVSSLTKTIDISADLKSMTPEPDFTPTQTELEETEFEEFKVKDEYLSEESGRRLIKKLSLKKRNSFLALLLNGALLLILSLFAFTPLSDFLIDTQKSKGALIICTVIFLITVIANFSMFKNLSSLFSKRCKSDSAACLAALFISALCVVQIVKGTTRFSTDTYFIILIGEIMLFLRGLNSFWNYSSTLGNLKQITVKRPKKAVSLITDTATTFAMAKNSIDGDILIATPRKAEFISGFMKYTRFGSMLKGKMPAVLAVSVLISLILGMSSGMYHSDMICGFYTAAVTMCMAIAAPLFLIDELPVYSASKKLNKKGAMIAGRTAAEHLETANASVISTTDIFPDGTVTLQNMQILSENNIDDTLIRAAALTEAVGSPLTPIFKKIAKTTNAYTIPDSDDVKYEDRLGLSGWIGDVMLFVGNRTLLESHGIKVPDVEIDKRILRKGYFPVYIACEGKACALIVIQYNVDSTVARELRAITELGVTLLVNNHDPNINEAMLCDYFGLYDDSVKIMSNAGVHMYKNATVPAVSCSAPAAFRSGPLTFISIMNCASKIKKSNLLISIVYILSWILGTLLFSYLTFIKPDSVPTGFSILIFEAISATLTTIIYLITKP